MEMRYLKMCKTDSIARRILGWKLNRWDRWYDFEKGVFIYDEDFQPEQDLDHAMIIVERLQKFGFTYTTNGTSNGEFEVSFNNLCARGATLQQAITNAAYAIIEQSTVVDSTRIWQPLC